MQASICVYTTARGSINKEQTAFCVYQNEKYTLYSSQETLWSGINRLGTDFYFSSCSSQKDTNSITYITMFYFADLTFNFMTKIITS